MASNEDIFAPPTQDELKAVSFKASKKSKKSEDDLFAPPTEEELALTTPVETEEPGLLSQIGSGAMDVVGAAGRIYDRYISAPPRAAIGAAQEGRNPISAYVKQFGEDPELAPTAKALAQRAGVSDTALSDVIPQVYSDTGDELFKFKRGGLLDPTASGAVGLGIDIVADPTNIVPVGAIAKVAGKGALGAAKAGAKGLLKTGDILTGTKALSQGGEFVGRIGSHLANRTAATVDTVLNPKQAEDWAEMAKIAERNGIDPSALPESVEFGPSSEISRSSRAQAESLGGEARRLKYDKAHEAVQGAVDNQIQKISGGLPTDRVSAGDSIRKGYDEAVDNLFGQNDFTYSSIHKMAPAIQLTEQSLGKLDSKLSGIEKFAKGVMQRGVGGEVGEAQAKDLLKKISAIKRSGGNLKQVVEQMQDIGRQAFKSQNIVGRIPPDIKKLRELYSTMSDAVVDSTRTHLGDDIANSLVENNARMTDFFKKQKPIADIVMNEKVSPEQLFDRLVANGNTNTIKALTQIIPPERLGQVKGALLESTLRKDLDGAFSYAGAGNRIQGKRAVLSSLISPEDLGNFQDLVRLGDRFGPTVLSTSGTGASATHRGVTQRAKGLLSASVNDATLDQLIKRARENGNKGLLSAAQKASKSGTGSLNKSQMSILKEAMKERIKNPIKSRSRLSKIGKASQVISQQQDNEDE